MISESGKTNQSAQSGQPRFAIGEVLLVVFGIIFALVGGFIYVLGLVDISLMIIAVGFLMCTAVIWIAIHRRQWLMVVFAVGGSALSGFSLCSIAYQAIPVRISNVKAPKPLGKLQLADVSKMLHAGRLAELPANARNLRADGWDGLFTGEEYLMFNAPADEVDSWLSASPGLKETVEHFDAEHMLLPQPDNDRERSQLIYEGHELYYLFHRMPRWYRPTVRVKGRRYEIEPDESGHNWGTVVVDDETNTVYVKVIWS
ncbi:hypothetical protein STSP2_00150 [Anaerohalosphaera lusitana]|uniref:Uncharacterized protein n=1 Tax=Anaerohalosphaera lusitana TaxID=1936003 RepID=A0A1U9NGF4_9BACT|nr:hypothetical protein [Anaerohalosphaera lusitana]AQT67012.1 hypothetical protein STSP2_00150 [Anaerohalosphaera lusitana]